MEILFLGLRALFFFPFFCYALGASLHIISFLITGNSDFDKKIFLIFFIWLSESSSILDSLLQYLFTEAGKIS